MIRGWKELKEGMLTPMWQRLFAPLRGLLREEGQALVEFAMSCLVLILILFGCIEACLGFYTYNFVADAAREATRYAAVRGSTSCYGATPLANCDFQGSSSTIQNYVRSLGYPGLTANNLTAKVTWLAANTSAGTTTWKMCAATCNQPGNQVQVAVQYKFPFGVPFVPTASITISSASSMVISQ